MFETEAITTLMGFIRQFREMERARRPLFAYRLTGKVKLQDHSLPLPFEVAAPWKRGRVNSETALMARVARTGVGAGTTLDATTLSPEMRAAIEHGMADRWVDLARGARTARRR
jgi:hypothetical protein